MWCKITKKEEYGKQNPKNSKSLPYYKVCIDGSTEKSVEN